jgi:hypothetical protein
MMISSVWTILYSHQQCIKVPNLPTHSHQYLLLFVFLIIAILIGELESQYSFDLHFADEQLVFKKKVSGMSGRQQVQNPSGHF